MRLPFCPPVPTRSPDVPEGVVGRFVPTASPVPARGVAAFLLAAEVDEGVSPLPFAPLLPVLGDAAAVCLGDSDVLDVLDAIRLAFLIGVVGVEFRP